MSSVLKTSIDLAANNTINSEVDRGAGGLLGAVEGLLGHSENS